MDIIRRRKILRLSAAILALFTGLYFIGTYAGAYDEKPGLRIMPLGDSITQGDADHDSYRRELALRLKNAGYMVNFVGSHRGNYQGVNPHPDFDTDNEGHWGFTCARILEGLEIWVREASPDVVLVHLGTNDLNLSATVETTLDRLSKIIRILQSHNKDIKIFLAQLIPFHDESVNQSINAFNAQLAAFAQTHSTTESKIVLVDQNTGFTLAADSYDGIHPNESGEKKMAQRWFVALSTVLGPPATPTINQQ